MIDDLRQLMNQGWRQRARVYTMTALALMVAMTAFGFDPLEQAHSGASVWIAFAMGALALTSRGLLQDKTAGKPTASKLARKPLDRHNLELESRNLRARV